jgi:hypothetical protein
MQKHEESFKNFYKLNDNALLTLHDEVNLPTISQLNNQTINRLIYSDHLGDNLDHNKVLHDAAQHQN